MFSNYNNKNANVPMLYLADVAEQSATQLVIARQTLVKNLIECSLLVNHLRARIASINLGKIEQADLFFLLSQLAIHKTCLAECYSKARINNSTSLWLAVEKIVKIVADDEKACLLNSNLLQELIKNEEDLMDLSYKINEEIASIVSPVNPIENSKPHYDSQYNLFLKQGGINSYSKALTNEHFIQYEILKNGQLSHNKISYLYFYLAALLAYIGEENIKKFYSMCRYSGILKKDSKDIFVVNIWPSKPEEKFFLLENQIIYILEQEDIFLISMTLKNISKTNMVFFLNQLLGYSSYFNYINKSIKQTLVPVISSLDQNLLYNAILLAIKNYDVAMFNCLISLLQEVQLLVGIFFEIIKLSPNTNKEMEYEEIFNYFVTNHHCFIGLQDKDKNTYPFFALLLSNNPIKEKLANELLIESSVELRRKYVIFLYENLDEFNNIDFAKTLLGSLSFDDILFVIKQGNISAPSFLHTIIEERHPEDYLAYAITQSKRLNEDKNNLVLLDLPEHWCQTALESVNTLKEHGYELILALQKSYNIHLKEITLKIIKNYLKNRLGVATYRNMLMQHEPELKIAMQKIKDKEIEIKIDNELVCLTFYPVVQEENQVTGNKHRINAAIDNNVCKNKEIVAASKKPRIAEKDKSTSIEESSKEKWNELQSLLTLLKKETIQNRQANTTQEWLKNEFEKAVIAEQRFILDSLLPFITTKHLLAYFFKMIADNKKKTQREYAIRYLIEKFPSFLAAQEQNTTKRYPIIIFLGKATAIEKEKIGSYLIEQSPPALRKAYFNFILNGKHPYDSFRHIITESLSFEDLLSMARERHFPILFHREHHGCLHLLHEVIVKQSNDIELIIYAIEQSRHCKIAPMLNNLHHEWGADKLNEISYLNEHGHELLMAAAHGYHKERYGIGEVSVLEVSIMRHLKEKLGMENFSEISARKIVRPIEDQHQYIDAPLTTESTGFCYYSNNPYFIFNNENPLNSSPLTQFFAPHCGGHE